MTMTHKKKTLGKRGWYSVKETTKMSSRKIYMQETPKTDK